MADPGMSFGKSVLSRRGAVGMFSGAAIDLALVVAAGVLISKIVWVVVSPASLADVSSNQKSFEGGSARQLIADPSLFARFSPFDRGFSGTTIAQEDDAPETTLNLTIRSLISSTDQDNSVVRIELPNGQSERFRVGDTVVNGVKLDRIMSDRVVLLRNGEREVLFAREAKVLTSVSPEGSPTVSAAPKSEMADPRESRTRFTVSQPDLEDLLGSVNLRRVPDPTNQGETLLRISPGGDPQALQKFGLEPGDMLLSLNGISLKDSGFAAAVKDLQGVSQLEVSLIRNESPVDLVVRIENGGGK